jgi:hypothetical protein
MHEVPKRLASNAEVFGVENRRAAFGVRRLGAEGHIRGERLEEI